MSCVASPGPEERAQLAGAVAEARLHVVEEAEVPDGEAERATAIRAPRHVRTRASAPRQRPSDRRPPRTGDARARVEARALERGREGAAARRLEPPLLGALRAVRLDHLDAGERLLDARREPRLAARAPRGSGAAAAGENQTPMPRKGGQSTARSSARRGSKSAHRAER